MTRFTSLLLGLLLAAAASQARAEDPIVAVDQATIEPAGISGYPGSKPTVTRQPGGDALLYAIGGGERGDNPCYLELGWSRQNADEHRLFATKFWRPALRRRASQLPAGGAQISHALGRHRRDRRLQQQQG